MQERLQHPLSGYGVALLATAISLLVRWPLWPVLGSAVPHMTFLPAVMVAAYFGGLGPGIAATILSAIAANIFLTKQLPFFEVTSVNDVVALILFLLIGTIISTLCESLHRVRRRLVSEERRRTAEALRETEERFRQLAENIHEIFWLTDPRKEQIVYISPGFEELCGRTRQSVIEQPGSWIQTVHPDDRKAVIENMDEQRRGTFNDLEFRVIRPDGAIRWIRNRVFPIRNDTGDVSRIAGLARDITRRKQMDEALRESEQRFRNTFENASIGIANVDSQGRWLRVNQRLCDIVGYTREEMLQKTFQEITHPDDMAISLEHFTPLTQGELPSFSLQKRYVRKDGSTVWVELFESLQRDAAGKPAYGIVMIQDISARKQLEEELRESEHRWRDLTETLPQLVWTATPDGSCDYFSAQWTQYTGVPESQLLGWQWMETLHPDDREPTRKFWLDSVADRHAYDVEYRVRRLDGEYRWFKTRGVPIRNSEGGIFKWFGTCTDITDGIRAAEELRLSKEAAESANRAKDEFLANVSHEIRTPMNAILGLTTLVLGTRLDDGQRQSLTTVKSAANSLLGIINDLLDFSKIEAGKLELDRGEFSLRAALGDTLRALSIRAHQKGLELASNVQPDVHDALIGDAGRLRQVLLNIVGNAIKFTEKGEVVVQVSCVAGGASAQDEIELLFTVRDTGIGIPREKHAAIFRAFEQEDSSTTRKYGGTGLGLTIAAQLAALMGGNITVDSEPGQGSTFRITARFGRSAKRGTLVGASASADLLENLRVLIVDDNLTNRQILEEWLQNWRMRPAAVGDGTAAVNALRQAAETGTPYSLALLDGRMPDTDGLTLAGQVRQRADLSSTRIILLTSDDTTISTARSREVGISAHLVKPVQQSELLETIRHVMSHTTADSLPTVAAGSTAESEPMLPAPALPLRILVAEDNEFNVTLMRQLFDRKGHRVRIAGDGREALVLATAGTFDVLLLDIHLPKMDGFAVAKAIRQQERDSGMHLPIIAFTARSGKQDRQRCLAAGMDDFLSKPVQADELWAVIDRVVARAKERQPDTDPSGTDQADTALLDAKAIMRACGGDGAILEKICQAFQMSIPNQITRVRSALRDKDATRLREAAHTLSSTLAAFSTVAGTAASSLEDEAARGQLQECIPSVERLEFMCLGLVKQTRNLSIQTLNG